MPYRNGKKQLKVSGWDAATMPTMPMSVEKRGWEPPIGKKEDGKLPLGSRDDADHARGKDHHGLPCHARPGFLVREAGNLEQLLCTLF